MRRATEGTVVRENQAQAMGLAVALAVVVAMVPSLLRHLAEGHAADEARTPDGMGDGGITRSNTQDGAPSDNIAGYFTPIGTHC